MIQFYTGDPGSGKSTQIEEEFCCPVLAIGKEIRLAGMAETIRHGTFGPDDFVDGLVVGFSRHRAHGVVDGYPRRPHQVDVLRDIHHSFVDAGLPGVAVVWFEVAVEAVYSRFEKIKARVCPECGKIGPQGDSCDCGAGFHGLDPRAQYMQRRAAQQQELAQTLARLRCTSIPLDIQDMSEVIA